MHTMAAGELGLVFRRGAGGVPFWDQHMRRQLSAPAGCSGRPHESGRRQVPRGGDGRSESEAF